MIVSLPLMQVNNIDRELASSGLRDLYNGATSTLKFHMDSDKIKLQR